MHTITLIWLLSPLCVNCPLSRKANVALIVALYSGFFYHTFAKTQGQKTQQLNKFKNSRPFWTKILRTSSYFRFNPKTQWTGSEIAIMNFKIPNICAKRAEKNQCLVYFEQISLPKIKKNVKTQVSWKKLKLFLKKTQAFWLQNSTNR